MIRRRIPCIAIAAAVAMLTCEASLSAAPPKNLAHVEAKPVQRAKGHAQSDKGGECCDQDECGNQCCGRRGRGRRGDGCGNNRRNQSGARAGNFSCGCNGSYKYPVPPLSTYHWPGMYSRQLMTDYQSPWRFPPLKPYTEEPPFNGDARVDSSRRFENVSFARPKSSVRTDGAERMSAKIQRLYGTR